MSSDPVSKHFFNGFIRLHILYHAAKEPIYGAEIIEELGRHGYRISQGTLYPTLHALAQLGYVQCTDRLIDGRRRKYYRATSDGRKILTEARKRLLELVAEVIDDRDEPFQRIRARHRLKRASKGRVMR